MRPFLYLIIFGLNAQFAYASFLFSEKKFSPSDSWVKYSKSEKQNIINLTNQLKKSSTGRELIRLAKLKAKSEGKKLINVIKAGTGSLTDTTLIRKFSIDRPEDIIYETTSLVFINDKLNQLDALLDLAHELTHYIHRRNFNPYQMNFTLSEFIRNTIEGEGGEVQAFMMECQIQKELFKSNVVARHNCNKIQDTESGKYSFNKAVKHFYRLGDHYDGFVRLIKKQEIGPHFTDISEEKITFVSSAYGVPYPVAAFEEYLTVINKVCENDKRRISYLKKSNSRSPASVAQVESDYKKKCSRYFEI